MDEPLRLFQGPRQIMTTFFRYLGVDAKDFFATGWLRLRQQQHDGFANDGTLRDLVKSTGC